MRKNRNVVRFGSRAPNAVLACSFLCLFLFPFFGFPLSAHEVRPAYLELHQTGAEAYDILWKVPGRGED